MKYLSHTVIAISIVLALSAIASAAPGSWSMGISYGDTHFTHDVSFTNPYPGAAYRIASSANGAQLEGGYQLNEHVAFELAYADYGNFTGLSGTNCSGTVCGGVLQEVDENLRGWSVSVIPQMRLTGGLSGFAQIGVLAWHMSPNGQCTWICPDMPDRSGTDALIGAGLLYDFPGHLRMKAGYRATGSSDLRATMIGIEWRF